MLSSSPVTQHTNHFDFQKLPIELQLEVIDLFHKANTSDGEKIMARLQSTSRNMGAVLESNGRMCSDRKIRSDIFAGKADDLLTGPIHSRLTESNLESVKNAAQNRLDLIRES